MQPCVALFKIQFLKTNNENNNNYNHFTKLCCDTNSKRASMKEGWKKFRLNDVVWFQRGFDLPKDQFQEGNIPVFGSTSILGYHNISKVKAPGVITGRSGSLGKFQIAKEDFWPHNTTLWVKDFKGNDVLFCYYMLQCLDFAILNTGGAVPTLNRNLLNSFVINLPPLETQRKIAFILSSYDDLIENNLKRIKLLEEKAQRTYEEWFVKMRFPGYETAVFDEVTGLPEGWKEGKLSDLIDYQSGFAFKSSKFKEEGYPIIKIKNIGNNTIDLNNVDYIDIEYANQVVKFQLNAGDLLIAMTGATVGKVGIMPKSDVPCYLNQRVGRFVSLKNIDNKAFVECFFNIGSGLNQVLNIAGGAAQPNISANQILSIETIVPSDTILKDFSQMATSITNSVINLQSQNRLLKEARDILLPRLMSGMIDVEDMEITVMD